jgi:ABC-type lipoprotein export system ATPase subunit
MRWFKCDLQMQTPGDRYNWCSNDAAYLSGNIDREELINSVDLYLKRCHEVGLEVIGITDHNFIGMEYLQMLQERNGKVASELNRDPITIFPGFEIEIAQGLGVHLLCLFDPNTSLDEINDLVTELGLPKNQRVINGAIKPVNKLFDEVIDKIQEHPTIPGIVIAAHPLAESGMLQDNFLTRHFQRELFTDSRLLAMEIPRPVNTLPKGLQKLIYSSEDCFPEWKRERPIATVMSSDAYSLYEGSKGYIGKRHTWIKMSKPSLEALRQAFLDHESRIRHQEESPEKDNPHGKIKSLRIQNVAFLEDQIVTLSPNLNCIIGGRGSGKSSVLEYIRLCTQYDIDSNTEEQVERIKKTLNENSRLTVDWEDRNGLIDTFEFSLRDGKPKITSRDGQISDPHTIFRKLGIQVYSQREITRMAQEIHSLLPLIDRLSGDELDKLYEQERALKDEIRQLQQKNQILQRLKHERKVLEQEISDLQRQWDAFVVIQEENRKRIWANEADSFLKHLITEKDQIIEDWTKLTDNLQDYGSLPENAINWLRPDYFMELNAKVNEAKRKLVEDIKTALNDYKKVINALTIENDQWEIVQASIKDAEVNFLKACEQQGLKPEELEILKDIVEKKKIKETQLKEKEDKILTLLDEVQILPSLMIKLKDIWYAQTTTRKTRLAEITSSEAVPKVSSGQHYHPFIEVDIDYFGDYEHFIQKWNSLRVNGRTKLGRNWEEIGDNLFREFKKQEDIISPWHLMIQWLEDKSKMPAVLQEYHSALETLLNNEIQEDWQEMQITRINDSVDITLYRTDGSRAGSLKDKGLSDGQKNTAILTLLFAEGTDPILIDQPEDELDSAFIYNELVPLLRNVKNKRQIILCTHNANLPVNGDAELVYALNANMGKGKVLAQGGLDQSNVRDAILDIMEGSEEAFRKRREKYHF